MDRAFKALMALAFPAHGARCNRRPIYFSITQATAYPEDTHHAMQCYGDNIFTVKAWLATGLDPSTLANSYLVE